MSTAAAYADLRSLGRPIIATADAAARLRTSSSNAGHRLRSAARAGLIVDLAHGLWALDPSASPAVIAPYLTAPQPAYVSLWSALAAHDMIEQIPRRTSVVSTARSRHVDTPLGDFDVHHVAPRLIGGFAGDPAQGYLATPEKALFDLVYVRAPRGGRLYLPELTLPAEFDETELQRWLERVSSRRIRSMVTTGLQRAIDEAVS